MVSPVIQTKRLRLVALRLEQLEICLSDPERLGRDLDVSLSPGFLDQPARRAIGYKVKKMAATAAALHPWSSYWLVALDDENHGIGLVGFKGEPDERGVVEIGFGIDPAHRCQGYATEAVRALITWAFQDPACRSIRADTLRDNFASGRVLSKLGMTVYHETDEGLCWMLGRATVPLP
jgi:RimJ/RimL family protein N-acetyltransferase